MRKRADARYDVAVEYAWNLLIQDYGVAETFVELRNTDSREPDLWSADKRVAVAIGVLREDTLLEYMKHFAEVVHLPLPRDIVGYPSHYRVFKRSRSFSDGLNIWGDSLIHGRSLRR